MARAPWWLDTRFRFVFLIVAAAGAVGSLLPWGEARASLAGPTASLDLWARPYSLIAAGLLLAIAAEATLAAAQARSVRLPVVTVAAVMAFAIAILGYAQLRSGAEAGFPQLSRTALALRGLTVSTRAGLHFAYVSAVVVAALGLRMMYCQHVIGRRRGRQ